MDSTIQAEYLRTLLCYDFRISKEALGNRHLGNAVSHVFSRTHSHKTLTNLTENYEGKKHYVDLVLNESESHVQAGIQLKRPQQQFTVNTLSKASTARDRNQRSVTPEPTFDNHIVENLDIQTREMPRKRRIQEMQSILGEFPFSAAIKVLYIYMGFP